jgi:hypothetical protein
MALGDLNDGNISSCTISRADVTSSMPHDAGYLSRKELLAYARSQGRRVSDAQLKRWLSFGLIPSPERKGLGRGSGVEARYLPVAASQLVVVADILAKDRSQARALWRLWWTGHVVDERRIRALLDGSLAHAETRGALMRAAQKTDTASEQFEREVRARLKDKHLSRMRRRVGKADFPTVVRHLVQLTSDTYDASDDEGARLVRKAFGVSKSEYFSIPWLRAMNQHLNPSVIRNVLLSMGPGELVRARDEVKPAFEMLISFIRGHPDELLGKRPAQFLLAAMEEMQTILPAEAFLPWLSLRAHPLFPTVFAIIAKLLPRPIEQWGKADAALAMVSR